MKSVHGELTPPLTAPSPRKRKRGASVNGDSPDRPHPQPNPQVSAKNHSTSLYDHISHILLEEDALRELNKRNRLIHRPSPPSPGSGSIPQRREEVSTELQRFARTGGPNLTDLRGYISPVPDHVTEPQGSDSKNLEMAGKRKADPQGNEQSESQKSRKTDATGAYDANFAICMAEQNVKLPGVDTPQPKNHAGLVAALRQKRPGPTDLNVLDSQWKKYRRKVEDARTESDVQTDAFPTIRGEADYPHTMNKLCTTWAQLFPDVRLKMAKPDFFDGLQPGSEYRLLRQQLNSYVSPAGDAPIMPNFFVEIKPSFGSEGIAIRQALHDGTLGAQGVYQTQKAAAKDPLDGNAHVFSGVFLGASLRLFAHFVSPPTEDEKLHYHMCELDEFVLRKSAEEYAAAIAAFQNLRDYAAKVRTELGREAESKFRALEKAGTLPAPLVAPNPSKEL